MIEGVLFSGAFNIRRNNDNCFKALTRVNSPRVFKLVFIGFPSFSLHSVMLLLFSNESLYPLIPNFYNFYLFILFTGVNRNKTLDNNTKKPGMRNVNFIYK